MYKRIDFLSCLFAEKRSWLNAFFCLILIGQIDAQIKHYQYFDISKGLISNDLTDVAEGVDGYIYLATAGSGISRYDGVSFEHFTNKVELGGLYFFEIAVVTDAIWFGGDDHMLEYKDGSWRNYEIEGAGEIRQILVYDADRLFCVGSNFSFFFSRANVEQEKVEIRDVKINQGILHGGDLFLATDDGIWKKSGGATTLIPSGGLEISNPLFLLSMQEKLMFFDETLGLVEWSSDEMHLAVPKSRFPSGQITFMLEGGLGQIYFGTRDQGIIIYQTLEELWLDIDESQLQNAQVSAMFFDRWDNAWISTLGGGLVRFSSQGFNTFGTERLSGRYMERIDKEGNSVFIHYRNGAWDQMVGGKISSYSPQIGERSADCWVKLDSATAIFGTGEGLVFAQDTLVTRLATDSNVGKVYDLIREDSVNVLVASEAGIYRLRLVSVDSAQMPLYDLSVVDKIPKVQSLIRNSNGETWYYSEREIGVMGGTRLIFSDTILTALAQFEDGLILGTRDQGLFFVDLENGMISLIPVPGEQLNRGEVRTLVSDQQGQLWIGLKNSIIQVALARGKPLQILKAYDSRNGLPRLEVFANSMEIDERGHVLVGTTSGILEILPEKALTTTTGPVLKVVEIAVDSTSFTSLGPEAREALRLINPGAKAVTITVKGIDQRVPKDLTYFYKCTHIVSDWTESRTGGAFSFFSLGPGNYDFEVKVQNSEGLYSETIVVPFAIQQPYYSTWWFILLIAMGAMILIYAFYRWRLNTRLHESRKKALELQTQNRILHLEHAASRLQMNPHFIFNALQSIQQKVAVGDRVQARMGLQTFSKLMRGYLEHNRKERILLEDELELLKQYLTVEKELKDHSFEYLISVPEGMDTSFVEIPAMMIQPFVENAIKHGLPKDHSLGMITIVFSWQGKLLRCQIDDRGPGISEVVREKNHNSAGMRITRDRLETYFKNEKVNPLTVETYQDDQGNTCGTRVVLLLPTTF